MTRVNLQPKIATAVITALLALAFPAWGKGPEITKKIDVPGAVVTVASGINPDGTIVGWYCLRLPCNALNTRGFLLSDEGWTYIDVPNSADRPALGTQPRYISPQGVVIGAYFSELFRQADGTTAPRFRGFAWYQGSFSYFDAPDLTSDGQPVYDNPSWPHSIIPRIHDKDQMDSMHGFLSRDGEFTRLTSGSTMNNGVTESGEILGLDFANLSGYRIDKSGNVETLTMPGAQETYAWDINSRGEIVGVAWTDNDTVQHAFLRSKNGDYSFVDPAGALAATAFAINSSGDVVGNYRDAVGKQCSTTACVHGFLLQRGHDLKRGGEEN